MADEITDEEAAEEIVEVELSDEQAKIYNSFKSLVSAWECDNSTFIALYEEACVYVDFILNGIESYFEAAQLEIVKENLIKHYIIVNPLSGALYEYYAIANKDGGIIQSASNSGSSSSLFISQAYSQLDFLGLDLLRTPYGKWAYSILSKINPTIVIL